MKQVLFICLLLSVIANSATAQNKHKHHIRHTVTSTLSGAKYGPVGAAGGFVVGRHLDKKKERKESKADTSK